MVSISDCGNYEKNSTKLGPFQMKENYFSLKCCGSVPGNNVRRKTSREHRKIQIPLSVARGYHFTRAFLEQMEES